MAKDKIAAYEEQQRRNLSPREVEAMAFTKAALMLEDARKFVNDITQYSKALRFNHLLWTIIQADLTDPENQLPPEIKANVMSLSIFVDKQTTKALRSKTSDDLNVLININRNLAAGLRGSPEAQQPQQTVAPVAATGASTRA